MLRILRCFVYFGVLAVVPAADFLAGFVLAPFLNCTPHERWLLGWALLPALLGVGVFEARLYSYELRSLTPRPLASAGAFVLRLGVDPPGGRGRVPGGVSRSPPARAPLRSAPPPCGPCRLCLGLLDLPYPA